MIKVLAVGCGGFLGAVMRYLVTIFFRKNWNIVFPIATLFVNILGGVLIGFIMEYTRNTARISDAMKLFMTTGFLGGLTTFSTFSYETLNFIEKGNYWLGGFNVLLNLVLSIFGAYIGIFAAKLMKQHSGG